MFEIMRELALLCSSPKVFLSKKIYIFSAGDEYLLGLYPEWPGKERNAQAKPSPFLFFAHGFLPK